MTKVLECYNLTKKIKNKTVVNNVSFDISEGEILGFIGPNGAGKTTIIKMILGLSKLDNGVVLINNYSIDKDYKEALASVGAIIENPDLYSYLTGYQNLKLLARSYKLSSRAIDEVVSIVGLENSIHNKVNTYSLGMKQRLGIAASLLHNPKLIILDEPLNGLDPKGIKEIRELLIKLASEEHKAILISSHILSELETFCNRICLLKDGKLIYNAKVQSNNTNERNYQFSIADTTILEKLNIKANIIDNCTFTVTSSKSNVANLIKLLTSNNIDIFEVKELTQTLEELFFKRIGEDNA